VVDSRDILRPKSFAGLLGAAPSVALATLGGGRIGIAAQALGIAQASVEASVQYANQRSQFDRKIGEFDAIRAMLADSAVELERMVDERTAALRLLSSRLMTMQDDERRRIARELHDGLGQELVAIKLLLNSMIQSDSSGLVRQINEVNDMIDLAAQQIRSLSHLLHPPLLDEVGLLSALRWYLDGLTKRSGIETILDVQPADFPRLAPELERAAFRIIQEALTNVFRHSGAQRGWVTVIRSESEVIVRVRDEVGHRYPDLRGFIKQYAVEESEAAQPPT